MLINIAILFFLELAEASLIKATTFKELAYFLSYIYHHKKIYFIAFNLSIVYVLIFMFYFNNFSFLMMAIVTFKGLDLILKIKLAQDPSSFSFLDDSKLSPSLKYSGCVIYPILMFLALS